MGTGLQYRTSRESNRRIVGGNHCITFVTVTQPGKMLWLRHVPR